jgi:putative membrane protein
MKLDKHFLFISILAILHVVGILGISFDKTRELVLSLSFVNLLIGFLILIFSTLDQSKRLLVILCVAFVIGYVAELIGVHTGLLFGDYWYGKNLGPKLAGVPLIIGINWGVLALTSSAFTESISVNKWVKIMINSALMVTFDVVMEPVAMKSDFWSWSGNVIPIYNYICWFFVAIIIQFIYLNWFKVQTNIVFKSLFIIQFLFFIVLNLM